MSTDSYSEYFRRRPIGRAPSPPTWACYEQIPYDDDDFSDSGSDEHSCSEDDEDYGRAPAHVDSDSSSEASPVRPDRKVDPPPATASDGDMDIDESDEAIASDKLAAEYKKDVKGKQRAIEPEPESSPKRQHHKKRRQPVYTLRPILTIQKSQGFVWNQDLFVPPYIKDRYVASTSPSNSRGFHPSSLSSNSSMTDYEVEVVEIRVKEGELKDIIP
ncbi:uncharacterized protein PHACADRAFT_108758 [Phanerochaete carnosa HHB-10118-sp]|uniref:Uncharacterized protein n=1 Tax=Phanerochaete carnosa (strain HHB-10118-sp) TaxID=650164 RepID=K5UGE0_PHACS|nr:uncharacterized protein PHACADRAFT_108758 [Phanerochaete carnosa HHB-10118-sp]EKM48546.1 hypothetical protein PHACADRAFT_108758 [Phanerochaete carnosa HHB-10118-sp]